jgi:hypothetical protein
VEDQFQFLKILRNRLFLKKKGATATRRVHYFRRIKKANELDWKKNSVI